MNSLFSSSSSLPLSYRMRPKKLEDFVGQTHLINKDSVLNKIIENDAITSMIISGPPGSGKTTLATIISEKSSSRFVSYNAAFLSISDIKKEIAEARSYKEINEKKTLFFIDEIHRLNKILQDSLLEITEQGTIILIGATTENPYFALSKALISRSSVYIFEKLKTQDIKTILYNALKDEENGYGKSKINIEDEALLYLSTLSSGDARYALNMLEKVIKIKGSNITLSDIKEISSSKLVYDKDQDEHYNIISAFIKSMRGSDPDATLYYLAKMILSGEDPMFIFRRMLILASEDVGMANPYAVMIVNADREAFEMVGFPEGKYHLSHAALFLALCPKSNSINAYFDAEECAKDTSFGTEVPVHLRNFNAGNDKLSTDNGYKYPHDYPGHYVEQQYLPNLYKDKRFYVKGNLGWEAHLHLLKQ